MASSSSQQNPLNPLNLPPIVKTGSSYKYVGDTMPFDIKLLMLVHDSRRLREFKSKWI
ncbi:hypothetical protein A2U01_0044250 [Trifolium medium]|uniref:Uncharacterized protein n=1 Tax=Trifolium medium TaxID=97028 RepID=A0A392QGT0_9FABA|nr:hypothetical protein [Trifolium medium]